VVHHSAMRFHFFPADDVESVRVMLDLEWDAVRRRSSLRSFASFKRCASNFWYSAASSRFFVARRRFCAKRWRLRCSTRGVTRRWIFGAFVVAFLPTIRQQYKPTALSVGITSTLIKYCTLFITHQHAYACTAWYCYGKLSVHFPSHSGTVTANCPSVILWYCIETNARIIKLFLPSTSRRTTSCWSLLPLQNSKGNSIRAGIKYIRSGKSLIISKTVGAKPMVTMVHLEEVIIRSICVRSYDFSDLESRDTMGHNFLEDFHNYSQTVWPRVAKFGMVTNTWVCV